MKTIRAERSWKTEKLISEPGRIRDRIIEKSLQLETLQAISSPIPGGKVKKSIDPDKVVNIVIKRQQVMQEIQKLETEYQTAKRALYQATDGLPELQGYIIMAMYGSHLTADQVAARLGKSKSYVFKQRAAGLEALDARARG